MRVGYAQAFRRMRGSPRRSGREGQEGGGDCWEILETSLVVVHHCQHRADVSVL